MKLEPPSAFYEHLGRVVAAAAGLEAMLADVVTQARWEPLGMIGASWKLASHPGAVMKELKEVARGFPNDVLAAQIEALRSDSHLLLQQRNTFVHSVLVLDPELGDEMWRHIDPRTSREEPLPLDEMRALTAALHATKRRASELCARLADYWRTHAEPT